MTRLSLPLALAVLAAAARADVLHVPKDFPQIQDAIDAAQAGDEIVIAAGTYEGVFDIDGKVDLHLRGQGTVHLIGSVAGEPNLLVSLCQQITLERLRIEDSEGDGIRLFQSSTVTLLHCVVSAAAEVGVDVDTCDHVTVEHCLVTGSGSDGLLASNTDTLSVIQSTIKDSGLIGLQVSEGQGHLLDRVIVDGSVEVGIGFGIGTVQGLSGSILRKCVVRNTQQTGIEVNAVGALVDGNRIFGATNSMQLLGDGCVVRKNRCVKPSSRGVLVSDGSHQVLENRVIKPLGAGVAVSDSGNQLIRDNTVIKPQDGFTISSGSNGSTLMGNRVVAPLGRGYQIAADETLATDNRVSGAGDLGFDVVGAGCLFVGNKAKGSANFDLFDSSGSANTYVDNDFGTTSFN
ncbi:MAG TPA: right-handed parallel beta-helix repeat-containing protein [Planctomycetota bacterium]|nr:right-handed parallel beta-helix repeat-containing protein [Planctomycetota bacterium]